jgi:signal transduction histidine kinase/FixJ family two-component response regulator/HPt (histidine-containing phosphotransfer) domain-containing protein
MKMSIRLKIILAINSIAVLIIVLSAGAGLIFTKNGIEKTMEGDLSAIADVADNLVTSQINLLKANAKAAALKLTGVPDEEFQKVLEEQVEAYDDFMALTVFDRDGIVGSAGEVPTPAYLLDSEYVQKAFAGESVISTTRNDPSRKLVLHICVPMSGRVLSATISGMFFYDLLSNIKIWDTGHIFIDDAEGTVIANIRPDWVLERRNFITMARTDSQYQDVADTISLMIQGKSGFGRFSIGGVRRICAYKQISGSLVDWSLGVVAPLVESPLQYVRHGLIMVVAICLPLSLIASFFAAGVIEKPYKKAKEMLMALEHQTELLSSTNDAAALLLRTDVDHFERDLWKCMDIIACSAGVDRMRIWKSDTVNGQLFYSLQYEWLGSAEPTHGKGAATVTPCIEPFLGWEEKLSAGHTINGIVRNLSLVEQAQLLPHGVVSFLAIPVFFSGNFWGFIGYDDCRNERKFTHEEASLLRTGSIMISCAILNNEMMLKLIQAQGEAVAGTVAKSDFLANMSHEMRTPLNAIIGLSELALDINEVQDEARENMEKIYNSGMLLLSLINDILDLSKIESGKFELIPAEYDTPSLINDTITLNIVRVGSKPITFNLIVDAELPNLLLGDEIRIKQIFNNLLSNAFKYTNEGSVNWHISFERNGEDVWLVSSIKDTGIGIRQKDIEKLFFDYNQVDTKSNRKIEGTGLGLSISMKLAALMDGSITVESEYGKGSTFTVRVRQGFVSDTPIGRKVVENLKSFHYSDHKRDRSAKLVRAYIPYAKVLVVDDVATNLDVAKGMLKQYGMRVDCVLSGREAIERIRSGKVVYNAIFMDHMMPELDGIETTRIIREEIGTEYARNIPVIALTANAITGNSEMFLKKGFQAFLSKPIDIMLMDAVIRQWVRDKELEKEYGELTPAAEISGKSLEIVGPIEEYSLEGIELKKGLDRFGGDPEIFLKILRSYVTNTPPLLEKLSEITREGLAGYAITVHGLKGSSRSICAERVGSMAETLEHAAKASDLAFVRENNEELLISARKLVDGLRALLDKAEYANPKQKKDAPNTELLEKLRKSCEDYDIDGIDEAMAELESFEYERRADLILWLRERIDRMDLEEIFSKLSDELSVPV